METIRSLKVKVAELLERMIHNESLSIDEYHVVSREYDLTLQAYHDAINLKTNGK
jgi:hypothetical protein